MCIRDRGDGGEQLGLAGTGAVKGGDDFVQTLMRLAQVGADAATADGLLRAAQGLLQPAAEPGEALEQALDVVLHQLAHLAEVLAPGRQDLEQQRLDAGLRRRIGSGFIYACSKGRGLSLRHS